MLCDYPILQSNEHDLSKPVEYFKVLSDYRIRENIHGFTGKSLLYGVII
jgi:hypothetical protein